MTPAVEALRAANPFPGLRAFTTHEADRFFGRERQIADVEARLADTAFLAVSGSSGCGKSSLVLAGLLGALARRHAEHGGTRWIAVVMRPGNHPIAALAEALAAVLPAATDDPSRAASLAGDLRLGGLALVEIVRLARLPPHARLLLVVDQFEEIFRFEQMTDPDETSAFVKLLLNAATDAVSPLSVVLTLRSDKLGSCAEFRGLPEAVNHGLYLVPRLTREQRKDAIVRPIEWRGARVAPRLVQRLLNDVSDDFDDLPVMQHALARTWEHWAASSDATRPIDLVDYESDAVGGKEALSVHADEAADSLEVPPALVERIFRALTELKADGVASRRPLQFDLLCRVVDAPRAQVAAVVERFRRPDTAFLMPSVATPLEADSVVDLSHESLIRLWGRLREWVRHEAKSRAELLPLLEAARDWQSDDDLLDQRKLGAAQRWVELARPNAAWVGLSTATDGETEWQRVDRFLAAGAARQRDREARRKRARLRNTAGASLIVVLVVVLIGLWVGNQVAQKNKTTSESHASRALLEIDRDPALAARRALAAVDADPDNPRAQYALRQALSTLDVAHTTRIVDVGAPIVDARYGVDHSHLVVATSHTIRLFDAVTLEPVGAPIAFDESAKHVWLMAGNRAALLWADEGVQAISLADGRRQALTCPADNDNLVHAVAVSADERRFALGCHDGQIGHWTVGGSEVHGEGFLNDGDGSTVTALAFSHDGAFLAGGNADGIVRLWKFGIAAPWIDGSAAGRKVDGPKHAKPIRDVAFHPDDGSLLATASDDAKAVVWRLDLDKRIVSGTSTKAALNTSVWPLAHPRGVGTLVWVPRNGAVNTLLTVSQKEMRLWDGPTAPDVHRQDNFVVDAAVSDDGELMVSSDGTARVWSTREKTPVATLAGHLNSVTRVLFVPRPRSDVMGTQDVLTASSDGTLRVWRLQPPRIVVAAQPLWMLGSIFDREGRRVLVCGERRTTGHQCSVVVLDPPHGTDLDIFWSPDGNVFSYPSWSADGRYLLGLNQTQDIFQNTRPVAWRLDGADYVAPAWLKDWRTATFASGGDRFFTVRSDGRAALWDQAALGEDQPSPVRTWTAEASRWWASMSPDGRWIATIEGDHVVLWSGIDPAAPSRPLAPHRGDVRSVRFSADSRSLVTASADQTARVWRLDDDGWTRSVALDGHTAMVASADFNPDATQVVTASADNTVRVWNARDGALLATLRIHSDAVNEAHFNPDPANRSILSSSDDGTAKLSVCRVCDLDEQRLRTLVEDNAMLVPLREQQLRIEVDETSSRWSALMSSFGRRGAR